MDTEVRVMQQIENVYSLTVDTPEGGKRIDVRHRFTEYEDGSVEAELTADMGGREIHIKDSDTEYLLYRLAKMLPEGWTLRCCLSCRHGNFCPVGDADNEIFCVSDFEPKQKSDLFDVTEDENECMKRSRNLFHVCGKYVHQTAEYYTYSSYLYEVHGIED
jgi:hypothetical protein